MHEDPNAKLIDPDLCTLRWVFETGEDLDPDTQERHPYRTVFALFPGCLDDRMPLADLVEEADDDVGRLMAAAPSLRKALKRLLQASGAAVARSNETDDEFDPEQHFRALSEYGGAIAEALLALGAAGGVSCPA